MGSVDGLWRWALLKLNTFPRFSLGFRLGSSGFLGFFQHFFKMRRNKCRKRKYAALTSQASTAFPTYRTAFQNQQLSTHRRQQAGPPLYFYLSSSTLCYIKLFHSSVVSKLINSGSKLRPKKYQHSGDKERGRRCVGLSWYTKLCNIRLRLHLWLSPFIFVAQYCWHSLIYKCEIAGSLLRSKK